MAGLQAGYTNKNKIEKPDKTFVYGTPTQYLCQIYRITMAENIKLSHKTQHLSDQNTTKLQRKQLRNRKQSMTSENSTCFNI